MAQDQRRTVQLCDDVGHRERLSGARHAQQRVVLRTVFDGTDELFDCLRLVAHWGVVRYEFEIHRTKLHIFSDIERKSQAVAYVR